MTTITNLTHDAAMDLVRPALKTTTTLLDVRYSVEDEGDFVAANVRTYGGRNVWLSFFYDSRTGAIEANHAFGEGTLEDLGPSSPFPSCFVNGTPIGPCPHCGEEMEYGDELPSERICDGCVADNAGI